MKKIKKYLSAFLIGVGAFAITGKVNAAFANNFDIVCNPTSLEANSTANCYLVAQIDGSTGIYGVTSQVTSMKHLKLYTGDGSTGVHGANSSIKAEYKTNGQESAYATGLMCKTDNANGFCANFLSAGSTNAILPNDQTAVPGVTDAKGNKEYNGYTAIGYYTVELDDKATTKDCGELCVSVQYAETQAKLATDASAGTLGKPACDEITPIISGEITVQETPETGAFASYAVLAAGAFIAISAIAIAKKHNKFYKV